ncbi:glycosyl hydrolase [Aureococcus anophagefferens]|nr:glycosyl hydrolase [Aureococcus anophagefferens]
MACASSSRSRWLAAVFVVSIHGCAAYRPPVLRPPRLAQLRVRAAAVAVPKHPKTNSVGLLRRVRGSSATARAVFIPAFAVAVVAFQSFTYLCVETGHFLAALGAATNVGDSMIVQQTPDVLGIIFSVFASNTFTGLYEQQELAHVAVYAEVSVARALLEQLVLVLGGPREPRCRAALAAYGRYLADLRLDVGDPRRGPAARLHLGAPARAAAVARARALRGPARGAALRDVRGPAVAPRLRDGQGRARRAVAAPRAVQRKLPGLQFGMLCALGASLLSSFVITVAGYAPGANLAMEKWGFAVLAFALVTCLRVLEDIWSPTSGAYSVSRVLDTMLAGLESELEERLAEEDGGF